jgi:hypothetical protein
LVFLLLRWAHGWGGGEMTAIWLFGFAIIVIMLWLITQRTRQQTGLPWGTTLASDVNDAACPTEKPSSLMNMV